MNTHPAHSLPAPVTPPAPVAESERSRGLALALCIPLGVFGAHRYYTGKVGTGLLMLFTAGGAGVWWLYDLIKIAAGEFRDSDGRKLRRWVLEDSSGTGRPGVDSDEIRRLAEQVDQLGHDVTELAERLDFTERMLARSRERDRLPER